MASKPPRQTSADDPQPDLARRLVAEAIGTALLLTTVVGSGIMAERLAQGNVAVALLANALATGAALVALIGALGAISGAHFNPVVTLVFSLVRRELRALDATGYIVVQGVAAIAGVWLAHVMFEAPVLQTSTHVRAGLSKLVSESVATFGLMGVILATARHRPSYVPLSVGAYITAAYWFTASTSFANPAVTLARTLTDTFAGIRPADAPGFIAAQLVGGLIGAWTFSWLLASPHRRSS